MKKKEVFKTLPDDSRFTIEPGSKEIKPVKGMHFFYNTSENMPAIINNFVEALERYQEGSEPVNHDYFWRSFFKCCYNL